MQHNIDISKRTSGEWKYNLHDGVGSYAADIEGSYGKDGKGIESIRTIAVVTMYAGKEESEANAAYICKAVNNHERLVKALSLSYDYMKELNEVAPGTLNETILNSIQTILNEVK